MRDACKAVVDAEGVEDGGLGPEGNKAVCDIDAFVLQPEGLHVMWSDQEPLYAYHTERATIPWRKLGKKLRPEGAACSFVWTYPDGGPLPGEEDPCR